MRTFRYTNEKKSREILSVFPMLKSEYWDDSPDLTYRAVSIWDHWLHLSSAQHLLEPNSHDEYLDRCAKFAALDGLIASNTDIYLASWRGSLRFKELRCADHLAYRLSPDYPRGGFMLVLPELKLIYTSGDRDEHTRVTYYQDAKLAKPFDEWVAEVGLKYIDEYPRTN